MAVNPGWAKLLPRLDEQTFPGVSKLLQQLEDAGDLNL
jgi:hypothetical protein